MLLASDRNGRPESNDDGGLYESIRAVKFGSELRKCWRARLISDLEVNGFRVLGRAEEEEVRGLVVGVLESFRILRGRNRILGEMEGFGEISVGI